MRAGAQLRALAVLAGVLLVAFTSAQDEAAAPPPRVLLFGDTTFQNHHGNAAKALQGRVEVVRSELGHLHTGAALARIEDVLAGEAWDLIVFNFGLGDLMCRDPRTAAIRAMSPAAGGVPVTTLEAYAAHLDQLVARFRESGAKLAWITTLPLSPLKRSGALDRDAVARYNGAALARMEAHGVPVVDAHEQIVDLLAEAENPRRVDPLHNEILKRDLSAPLVARILALVGASPRAGRTPSTRSRRP